MGRAERRRQERQARIEDNKARIKLTPWELQQIKRDTANRIATFDVELLHTCFAVVMYEKFGFDEDKIMVGLEAIDEKFGEILEGTLTAQDLADELEDATGLKVKFSKEW